MDTTAPAARYAAAEYAGDMFSDENLSDSRAMFRALRDAGDAVWVPALDLYVVARYRDVIAALRAPDVLISGRGISVNAAQNAATSALVSTLLADGERHRQLQRVAMRPLTPTAVTLLKERVERLADERVAALANGHPFEAVRGLSSYLPLTIIAEMVGIQGIDSARMLTWSNAVFDLFGPSGHARESVGLAVMRDFMQHMQTIDRDDLTPDGWAARLFNAADDGEITHAEARGLLGDYIVPSLDTTIYSTAQMLHGLATVPGAWDRIRADPGLIPGAVDEAVRIATPLRGFTRVATADFAIGTSIIPAGARVWLLYGAANLDERKYADPERFDVGRNPKDHLGWGHGIHLCLGKHLARLEMEAVLRAMLRHVARLECESSRRLINNSAQGFAELNMRLIPNHAERKH